MEVDEVFQETYEIIEQIGAGGGGTIYKAYHKRLLKNVVLKKITIADSDCLKNRQEADILKNLRNSYLPQIYDFVESKQGIYTVMDYIEGESFQQLFNRGIALRPEKIIKYAKQLCNVLDYLHSQNPPIIHGDIKPANIMLTPEDNICLIDFNISNVIEDGGSIVTGCTKEYASPEQYAIVVQMLGEMRKQDETQTVLLQEEQTFLLGQENGNTTILDKDMDDSIVVDNQKRLIDERSDIYSLGATLYRFTYGKVPSDDSYDIEEMEEDGVIDGLAYIIKTSMEKEKDNRYQNVKEIIKALENLPQMGREYKSLIRKQKTILIAVMGLFALGILGVLGGGVGLRTEKMNHYQQMVNQMEEGILQYNQEMVDSGFKKGLEIYPELPDVYYQKAVWFYKSGNYQEGIEFLEGNNQLFVKSNDLELLGNICCLKGNCWYEIKNYEKAVNEFQQALMYNDTNCDYYRDYAITLVKVGKLDEAKQVLQTAVDYGLGQESIYIVSGEIEKSLGHKEDAYEYFMKCIESSDSNDIKIRAYLMCCDIDTNNTQALLRNVNLLQQGILELPLECRGLLYEKLAQMYIDLQSNTGDVLYTKLALDTFEDIIDVGYDTYMTYINMEILYEQLGEFEKATQILDRVLDIYGDSYVTYKRMAFLEVNKQAEFLMEERNYYAFEKYYNKASELYKKESLKEDMEMQLLEKIYRQMKEGGLISNE